MNSIRKLLKASLWLIAIYSIALVLAVLGLISSRDAVLILGLVLFSLSFWTFLHLINLFPVLPEFPGIQKA